MATGGRSNEENPKRREQKADGRREGEKISYGRRFAQTEDLYAAHQMERELEELARGDGMLEETPAGGAPAESAQTARPPGEQGHMPAVAGPPGAELRMEELTRGAPIGALPTVSEPPPRDRVGEVIDDARRYTGMIRDAVRDIATAGYRLARLPAEVALLAARRLRPLRSQGT